MRAKHWLEIEQLCQAALKLEAGERVVFLKEACGEDEDLRREVERLLTHEETAEGFLEAPALEAAARGLAEDRNPSLLGQQLGSYQILAELGRGGMGVVYRARDLRLGREVAIKTLPSAFAADRDRLRRFEQEARAAGQLNHPNILTLYDVGTHQGCPYIVCEHLEGETLRERLNGKALPVSKAVEYALQMARGLAAAHEKGIVHRDLKPENVFLTRDGQLKILDFGLAKLTRPETEDTRTADGKPASGTAAGLVLGTVGYMAPEQVRGETVDHRADLFSLGAILYEMLSGQRAFQGESDVQTMNAIVTEEPPDLVGLNPEIPLTLQRILRHCLEKSPQQRYQSAGDIAFDLEMLADAPLVPPLALHATRAQRRDRLGWIAAVLALVLLAAAIAYFRRAPTESAALHVSLSPPEAMTFPIGQVPAISPDGRRLAFVAQDPSGKSQLYLRPLATPSAQALAGTEGASQPFWSPDNRFIAFFAQGKLKKISVTGGPPQALCDVGLSVGGTWGRNGDIMFGPLYGLVRVSQDGGPVISVATTLEGTRQETSLEKARYSPCFLPDGRHFLFTAETPRAGTRGGIYVGSLDSKESRRLLGDFSNIAYAPPGYLLFVRDWTLMAQPFDVRRLQLTGEAFPVADQLTVTGTEFRGAFSVSETGVLTYSSGPNMRELVWFNRAGQELGRVGTPDAYDRPSLSPDEKTVAVVNLNPVFGGSDVWLTDVSRGTRSRFTSEPAWTAAHIWSPDGSRIVFSSPRNGNWDLYQKAISGTPQQEVLFKSDDNKYADDWSLDGRLITYTSPPPGGGVALWVLPLFGDRQPIRFPESKSFAAFGHFSPNGRWLAYVSDESGGEELEIHVRPYPASAGVWQVSTGGGLNPRWCRDGKELFYIAPDGHLMAVEVETEGPFHYATPKKLFRVRSWGQYGAPFYAVSADGQRFLFAVPPADAPSPTIRVVLNWPAMLKKRPTQ
ncbi:MAG: protein kinase [Acidobacteriota bacterium]